MSTPLERAEQEVRLLEETARLKGQEVAELLAAVRRQDARFVRSEGHSWSGRTALALFDIADLIDPSKEADQ